MPELWLNLVLAVAGGFLPALVWLAFWLREDEHPEPRRIVIFTFCLGMAAVPAALVLQTTVATLLVGTLDLPGAYAALPGLTMVTLLVWALAEEGLKLAAAYAGGLGSKEADEPIDATVYLVAAALGFASLENVLYVAGPLFTGDLDLALLAGPLRFVGATTLHAAVAAVMGVFIGLSRRGVGGPTRAGRRALWVWGFVAATALHWIFNATIIRASDASPLAYAAAWLVTVAALVALEEVKARRRRKAAAATA